MKILISGASGLIGKKLTQLLESRSNEVFKLVRNSLNLSKNEIFWDPESKFVNVQDLENFDAIVNLSGENIAAHRWTKSFKKKMRESRLKTTGLLADTINKLKSPPKVFVSSSAIGFYGDRRSEELNESSLPGEGFLADLSKEWEAAAGNVKNSRVVVLRTGVVISREGGALKKMLLPFKLCLGGKFGDGGQFMSWISIQDMCEAIYFCIQNQNVSGPVNMTSPHPVTNAEFTQTLAKILKRPAVFPVPYFAAKILFGQMADETLFAGAKILPKKLLDNGFKFKLAGLEAALNTEIN